jgi:two-component system NtrC family sensor kinase
MHALRADGSEFPMEMVLWRTAAGGEVFYTASIADVSERHDAERQIERQREALRQSEKLTAMGSLLAGVAHELNNPLAIVMGRASLLEEKCEDQPELKADAARIREAAERCGRIVRTFLDMARNRPSRRSPVSLNEMARAAAEMLLYGYQTHDIELELSLAVGLPAVHADADQIGQVVMNLLVNAQQALAGFDGARRVRVETGLQPATGERQASVWLRVQDNGPGVDGGLRSRLFEPFFTTKAEGAGTGLGLAVSRSLARDHGGDVVLESRAERAGASFLLSLPLLAAETTGAPRERAAEPASAPQARLLVVDDEADLAALMRDMLEGAGYDVATAESGAIALELLDTARFDAIVSDLRMPDMDGAGLWREVSARHPELARRMLFVTGDTLSPDARQFLKAAKGLSLDKPFSKADLLGRVAALLE